ncbi:MAG: hypothetical protein J6T51_02695 [Kiritimatiellae bacterium]|nr:hypothetical protein [Kiritimatiellia bacterium]
MQMLRDVYIWLFVTECSTAAPLLSLSFAINSMFVGLDFSRFNLCKKITRTALKCIDNSTDDKFLERTELLGKNKNGVGQKLKAFSDIVSKYREAMQSRSIWWDVFRRIVTSLCALSAFLLLAFEVKNRIGLVLVLPYVIILFCHAAYVWLYAWLVLRRFGSLTKAMNEAEKESQSEFDISACIKKLKADRAALSSSTTASSPVPQKPPSQVSAPVRAAQSTKSPPAGHAIAIGRSAQSLPRRPPPTAFPWK